MRTEDISFNLTFRKFRRISSLLPTCRSQNNENIQTACLAENASRPISEGLRKQGLHGPAWGNDIEVRYFLGLYGVCRNAGNVLKSGEEGGEARIVRLGKVGIVQVG